MKKILSMLMVCMMMSNSVFAATADSNTNHNLMIAKAFDSFRYVMTVDLQPNNPDFQAKAIADFKQRMEQLQANGITPNEMMEYLRTSILDNSTRADFDRLLATMSTSGVTGEEAANLAMRFMETKYKEGANYSGQGTGSGNGVMIAVGVVVVGVITYFVVKHIRDNRGNDNTPDTCDGNDGYNPHGPRFAN